MASGNPERVRLWSFRQAPPALQRLFLEGTDSDWVAHVPESERQAVESSLLQWQPVYPVRSAELADRSLVYFGAPRGAIERIAERGKPIIDPSQAGRERRSAVRVRIECPSRYVTLQQAGFGHTIDMSSTGIAFTTKALLADTEVTLQVEWPVRLESGAPVQCHAVGKLARAEPMKAAMRLERMSFVIED